MLQSSHKILQDIKINKHYNKSQQCSRCIVASFNPCSQLTVSDQKITILRCYSVFSLVALGLGVES